MGTLETRLLIGGERAGGEFNDPLTDNDAGPMEEELVDEWRKP